MTQNIVAMAAAVTSHCGTIPSTGSPIAPGA
jgi:hypothetical protein